MSVSGLTVSGPLFTATEAAAYLHITVPALRALSRRGELPYVRFSERNTRRLLGRP